MCVRERILALRLLEKQKKNPDIAKRIGIEIQMKEKMNLHMKGCIKWEFNFSLTLAL